MANELLTEGEGDVIDEADIKIIDEPTTVTVEADAPAARQAPADEDDDDQEDARLVEDEDDNRDDANLSPEERKRRTRAQEKREQRVRQREARFRLQAEVQELRAVVPQLLQRLQHMEGAQTSSTQTALQQQLSQAEDDARVALELHAQAIDAGNGADAARALSIREQALSRAAELRGAAPPQQQAQPQADPEVVRLSQQWVGQNPWFKSDSNDPASMLTRAIDRQLLSEGFNPKTPAHWQELSKRVTAALDDAGMLNPQQRKAPPTEPPPTGMGRQHAPAGTKQEVHLSAERVQAMKDAGVWSDPVARTKMIKSYQKWDRENGSPSKG